MAGDNEDLDFADQMVRTMGRGVARVLRGASELVNEARRIRYERRMVREAVKARQAQQQRYRELVRQREREIGPIHVNRESTQQFLERVRKMERERQAAHEVRVRNAEKVRQMARGRERQAEIVRTKSRARKQQMVR
jgi:hypothetical protein